MKHVSHRRLVRTLKSVAALLAVFVLTSCAISPVTVNPPADDVQGAGRVTALENTSVDGTAAHTADPADTSAATTPADGADNTDGTDITDGADNPDNADTPDGTDTTASVDTTPADPPVTPPKVEYIPAVFMYHLILDEPYSVYESLFVRPSELEAHIGVLDSLGYDYAFAEEYGKKDRPTAILTFDDGYEDNYTEMFPILKRTGAKATVFLVKALVGTKGYLTEDQIREMSRSGLVSFQSHTANHVELASLSAERIKQELTLSIEYIESLTGKRVKALAYPAGRYSDAAVAEVGKYITFAYTTESPYGSKGDDPLLIPRFRVSRGCSAAAFRGMAEAIKP